MILRSNGRILGCDGIKCSNRILPKETREEARAAKNHFYNLCLGCKGSWKGTRWRGAACGSLSRPVSQREAMLKAFQE